MRSASVSWSQLAFEFIFGTDGSHKGRGVLCTGLLLARKGVTVCFEAWAGCRPFLRLLHAQQNGSTHASDHASAIGKHPCFTTCQRGNSSLAAIKRALAGMHAYEALMRDLVASSQRYSSGRQHRGLSRVRDRRRQ